MESKWYTVRCASGKEDKAIENVEFQLELSGMDKYVTEMICPKTKQHFMRQKKKVSRDKVMLPGYFLIHMQPHSEAFRVIKSSNLVAEVMGTGGKPQPMKDSEVEYLLGNAEKSQNEIEYFTDERVKIIDGPFSTFEGDIKAILSEKNKAIVNVRIFSQITPVELSFFQIEKL